MRATLASLRLAQHDPQAAAALAPVIDGSAGVQPFSVVAALLLEAMAHDAVGDQAAAGRALERALDLAGPNSVLMACSSTRRRSCSSAIPGSAPRAPSLIAGVLSLLARRAGSPRRPGNRSACASRSARPRPASCGTCPLTDRARDRRPALRVGEHCPDAHASPVPEARRTSPRRGRRAGPRARPARIFRTKAPGSRPFAAGVVTGRRAWSQDTEGNTWERSPRLAPRRRLILLTELLTTGLD